MSANENAAPAPFEFKDCTLITIALAKSARDLREMRDRVNDVPIASLHHHFFESMLRPTFDDPELGNDFAIWARDALRDDTLAERLAVIDPYDRDDGEQLRARLVDTLEERLAESDGAAAQVPRGDEFHFLRSQIVVFETGLRASDPREVALRLPELPPSSVFYHFVDARLRPPKGEDDFSAWLSRWGAEGEAARARLAAIDPVFGPLRELRRRVVEAIGDSFGGAP